jgi:1-deoxy-D-xylulose-5-phosphate reductoisomerase
MKGISVLGSTGSIGVQTLDIVRRRPDLFRVVALAAGSNLDLLEAQVREFRPEVISCGNDQAARDMEKRLADHPGRPFIGHSLEGLEAAATAPDADIAVAGLPGSTGLRPTFAAVEAGKDIALATKEVLVMAGGLFMALVRERGVKLLPVDSEQSAIFQCLQGSHGNEVKRIVLTASGGPFRLTPVSDLERVTAREALTHPRWKMGPKVTVDSATLMNKGLEVIEAAWLFDLPASRIQVVIHPQSIVHSMVEFRDGSLLAQLGATDMRIPISYALAYPDRVESGAEPVDFATLGRLTFEEPDWEKFPLLKVAYTVLESGDQARSVIMNAADEAAVELFLAGRIAFPDIAGIVHHALDTVQSTRLNDLDEVTALHDEVVQRIRSQWSE